MYPTHIQNAASQMAQVMAQSAVPLYGTSLRLPERKKIVALLRQIRSIMFPAYFGDNTLMSLSAVDYAALLLTRAERTLAEQVSLALPEEKAHKAQQIAREVTGELPHIQRRLLHDVDAIYDGDPAAQSREEVIFAYPGLFAIFAYRFAHELYLRRVPTIPRMISEYAHSRTGIDIHPGADIGEYFFIDHGTGIVIGETTQIGDHVKLYQGVTLGALSPRSSMHGGAMGKRHPTVESGATIYSGASILGGGTVIGENAVVGGNAFLTSSVQAGAHLSILPPEVKYKTTPETMQ